MTVEFLGTEYGGHWVDVDFIHDGDTVIDAGVGKDISFAEELYARRKVQFVFIDPSPKCSSLLVSSNKLGKYIFYQRALATKEEEITLWDREPNSSSIFELPLARKTTTRSMTVQGLSVSASLIKLDIEGAEYEVIKHCLGIPQITVECHHSIIPGCTLHHTEQLEKFLMGNGYCLLRSSVHDRLFLRGDLI